ISTMSPDQVRQGLSRCETNLTKVHEKLKSLRETEAAMIAQGDRHAGRMHRLNQELSRQEERRETTELLRTVYQEFLNRSSVPGRSKKPGPCPKLPPDFVEAAGTLYLDALRKSKQLKASDAQLLAIGRSLDRKGYRPPSKYLEKVAADEILRFNSSHSRFK